MHTSSQATRITTLTLLTATTLLASCAVTSSAPTSGPRACDAQLQTTFRPDALTRVIEVRRITKGEQLIAVDAPTPITAAADLCLVKMLVGPGATAERDRSARSYTEGIGIEVWLPTHANWNSRIRDYGGGGWVGGGHREPGKIGSKVPAIVNANMGYVSGTTDAGQPWSQNGSFVFLSNGQVNVEALRDFSVRSLVETALKTDALTRFYYGRPAKFRYFDGHSQGGRQAMKIAQTHPDLYDGYLVGQPALSIPKFGAAALYPQLVMKRELGFTAIDRPKAAAYAAKVAFANKRAVMQCDRAGLGFLLDPFSCAYDPARDADLLCKGVAGVAGSGITGRNGNAAECMSLVEANALNRIWYGATRDGSWEAAQTDAGRAGRVLGPGQLWWGFSKGTSIGGAITSARTEQVALALQDVRYAADASATTAAPIINASTPVRNRWQELDYAALAAAQQRGVELQPTVFADLGTDNPDLSRLRSLGRKIIVHSGLADDAIPVSGNVAYHERVLATMGGAQEVDRFMRMYLIPGAAHSSQGRPFAANGNSASVPLPRLPGNNNQNPGRDGDQFFSALLDWVELGKAPGEIVVSSRDGSVSYPLCVYPQRITWNGRDSAKLVSSYSCR